MKSLPNSFFLALLTLPLLLSAAHAADTATVNSNGVELTKKRGEGDVLDTLYSGMPVSVIKTDGEYAHIQSGTTKGWVDEDAIAYKDSSYLSAGSHLILCNEIFSPDDDIILYYAFDGELCKFDVRSQTVLVSYETGDVLNIYHPEGIELFVLEAAFTNQSADTIYSYTVFNPQTGKSLTLADFDMDGRFLSDISFSQSGNYVALIFSKDDEETTSVYSTVTGSFCAYATNTGKAMWWN